MSIVAPIWTGTMSGKPVRFFRSPLDEPDMPWHSVDDLYVALGLSKPLRRHFKQMLQGTWRNDVRTVATTENITTIAPHYMAQGLLDSLTQIQPGTPRRRAIEYQVAASGAMSIITKGMEPAMALDFVMQAFKRAAKP